MRGAALVVVWSSGFIGAQLGADQAPPTTLLAWRGLATAVLLLPWAVRAAAHLGGREWLRQGALALLCQCLYLAGVFAAAAAGVPAGTSALVASLQPALVLAVVVLGGRHRFRPAHLAGLALGTAGVGLTAAGDLSAGVGLAALALPLAAMLSLTAGTLLQRRWSAPRPDAPRPAPGLLTTLAVQSVVAAACFTAVAAATGDLAPPAAAGFWTAVAWSTAAGVGSYGLYYLTTERDGATRASTLLYLTPAATAAWAAAMVGQPLRATAVLGLLVSAGAVVLLRTAPGTGVQAGAADRAAAAPGAGNPLSGLRRAA